MEERKQEGERQKNKEREQERGKINRDRSYRGQMEGQMGFKCKERGKGSCREAAHSEQINVVMDDTDVGFN